jgi:hypothetical protein
MSETNITADSNQSANFFSKLMSKNIEDNIEKKVEEKVGDNIEKKVEDNIEKKVEDNIEKKVGDNIEEKVEENVKENVEENIEFLQKINSTPKSLTNNKMQKRIEEIESEIERYKCIQKEQEMKLNLFKKTISTLQLQLQEKSSHISRLEHTNNNNVNSNIKEIEIINELTLKIKEREDIIFSLEKEIDTNKNDFDQMKSNVQTYLNDKQTFSNKYLEMRQSYQILDNNYQTKDKELNTKIEILSKIEKELGLEKTLKINLQKELDILKNQMSEYIKDIKNITLEKDNEIVNLKQTIEDLKEKNNNVNEENKSKVIDKNIQQTIIGRARGINANLKRGLNTSSGPGIRPS